MKPNGSYNPNAIGFTGARDGMSTSQKEAVFALLEVRRHAEFHHGDCIGADAEAHRLAVALGMRTVVHPPDDERLRAWCLPADLVLPPLPYLVRNRAIVDQCALLIATPDSPEERLRSGTWSTVRYARTTRKMHFVVYPDGEVHSTWRIR